MAINECRILRWNVSLEYCLGSVDYANAALHRHVNTTGDIKDLIITEESGIAKGVRRVIAITGTEAREATHLAKEAEDELHHARSLKGKDKDKAIKAYLGVSDRISLLRIVSDDTLQSLDAKDISQIRKAQLREAHAKATKEIMDEAKAVEKAATKRGTDAVDAFFKENPNARVCVLELQGATGKPIQATINHVVKQYGRAAYFFTVGEDKDKVAHMNVLPKGEASKQFNAKEWMSGVSKIIGGRGGGKDESAQGVGSEVGKVGEAIEEAKKLYQQAVGSL